MGLSSVEALQSSSSVRPTKLNESITKSVVKWVARPWQLKKREPAGWQGASAAAGRAGALPQASHGSSRIYGISPDSMESSAVLDWLLDSCCSGPAPLKVTRHEMGGSRGWGLVATTDISPGEVLLSVPLDRAITSEGAEGERPWSVHMALCLLSQVQRGEASPIRPWVNSLPQYVPLPWLYFTPEQLEELQDPDTLAECSHLRAIFDQACLDHPEHEERDLAWAMSVIHSRSFMQGGTHVFVPGIDLCNHTPAPSAGVRCVHSPSTCQGYSAVEDVCEPPPPEPSLFELVAGDQGIRAGEEVTISYGSWPSDVFLLFFGFVPSAEEDNNEALEQAGCSTVAGSTAGGGRYSACTAPLSTDSVVMFDTPEELMHSYHHHNRMWLAGGGASVGEGGAGDGGGAVHAGRTADNPCQLSSWDKGQLALLARQLQTALGVGENFYRLVVTPLGFDQRLLQAASTLESIYPSYFPAPPPVPPGDALGSGGSDCDGALAAQRAQQLPLGEFLRRRCVELLGGYPTTWEEDAEKLVGVGAEGGVRGNRPAGQEGPEGSQEDPSVTALRFRMGKKAVLRAALSQLG